MSEIATKARDNVSSPPNVLEYVRANWGNFFDPCPLNRHPTVDGLIVPWGDVNYVNPPYSCVGRWVNKAYEEYMLGKTVVMFVKTQVLGRGYFQKIKTNCEIRFMKYRVMFPGYQNRAPFDSVFIILQPGNPKNGTFSWANI